MTYRMSRLKLPAGLNLFLRRLRWRHVAFLWLVAALLLTLINREVETGTVMNWVLAVPVALSPVLVLSLWLLANRKR
jgi:hypothetical protein